MSGLTASQENARTLAAVLGLSEQEAAGRLRVSLLVTADANDRTAFELARLVRTLLERTFTETSQVETVTKPRIEVIIGAAGPTTAAPAIHAGVHGGVLYIGRGRPPSECTPVNGALLIVAACYIAAAATRAAVDGDLPNVIDPLVFDFATLALPAGLFDSPILLGTTYLAGAGAVGNGLLWALRYFDVRGTLHIVDPDTVSAGNLNRQIWFEAPDVGKTKAKRLAEKAQPYFPRLTLEPREADLKTLEEKSGNPQWLPRLVVGVDSRRTRRLLQGELPGEVFDASTTGVVEVVLCFNRQPTERACMACIYKQTPNERAHEEHIAESLGVTVEDVAQAWINASAAAKIAARYDLKTTDLVGMAYDSVFKQLCGQQRLAIEGQQVLAPFAFVSVLAGALLAIEMAARVLDSGRDSLFNYWRVSPWHPPLPQQRRNRAVVANCEVCEQPYRRELLRELWVRRT